MPDAWIVNASPSIILGRIGRLELLDALSSKVGVPAAVIDEVRAGLADDPGAAVSLPSQTWLDGASYRAWGMIFSAAP